MAISPAEYLELMQLAEDSAGLHSMNALAVLFAYVTGIYIVGSKLEKAQIVALTCVYTAFYFFTAQTVVRNVSRAYRFIRDFVDKYPDEATALLNIDGNAEEPMVYVVSLILFLSWVLSIVFMRETRRKNIQLD